MHVNRQQKMSSELDFEFGSLSLNDAKPLRITVPNEAKGLIIGKGGETIKSIMSRTRTRINSSRDRSDSTFTITGSSEQAIKAAKAEIDAIVASFEKSKMKATTSRDANNNTYQQVRNLFFMAVLEQTFCQYQ